MSGTYTPNDKWAQKAQSAGFRARSVYKLQELDQKYHLLRPGMQVLDVGAAPGSWLQYASGIAEHVTGIDIQEIAPVAENVSTLVSDIAEFKTEFKFDVILSDIAPSTTGMPLVDQKKSVELNRSIFNLAKTALQPGGTLVMKVFEGREFQIFMQELKGYFPNVVVHKTKATRDSSHEIYVICS
jgi:23S rRNA (uridine2552-2'-O)-methyltransferase